MTDAERDARHDRAVTRLHRERRGHEMSLFRLDRAERRAKRAWGRVQKAERWLTKIEAWDDAELLLTHHQGF